MNHKHHTLIGFGRKDNPNGKLIQFMRFSCEEYEARYATGWKFFPSRRRWFVAWKVKG